MATRHSGLWMWAEACEALGRAERLHRQFFRPPAHAEARPAWEPPVDLYETERDYVIVVALPGVTPDRLKFAIDGRVLTVAGHRSLPLPADAPRAVIHRLEIPQGWFERHIPLPPGPLELGRHELADGCLVVTLHKPEPKTGGRPDP